MELTYERIGYRAPIEYDEWLKTTHFQKLGDLRVLYSDERVFLAKAETLTLRQIASTRLEQINQSLNGYE